MRIHAVEPVPRSAQRLLDAEAERLTAWLDGFTVGSVWAPAAYTFLAMEWGAQGWLVIAASVVVTASVIAEKSGPFVGGLILALPVSIGPAYVLLALQASPEFIAHSGLGSLASNVMVGASVMAYLAMATRVPLMLCLVAS